MRCTGISKRCFFFYKFVMWLLVLICFANLLTRINVYRQQTQRSVVPWNYEMPSVFNIPRVQNIIIRQDKQKDVIPKQKPCKVEHLNISDNSLQQRARHVVLLKVAKTGSSTMQNIFFRFAESRNLTVVLPHSNKTLMEACCENVISFNNSLTDKNIVKPPKGRHFEILCSHVIYNRTRMEQYFPKETVYIGIVREPIERFISAVAFYKMYIGVNMSDFAADPFKYNEREDMTTTNQFFKYPLAYMSNNRMAYEFGFHSELFPTSRESYKNRTKNVNAIKDYLKKLDNEFKLIMITERFDESLVLMKRELNWKIQDILYLNQNTAKREKRNFSSEIEFDQIKEYLNLDIALYEHAVKTFDAKIKHHRNEFEKEVQYFREIRYGVINFCNSTPKCTDKFQVKKSVWNGMFYVHGTDCELYRMKELGFSKRTRLRQYNANII